MLPNFLIPNSQITVLILFFWLAILSYTFYKFAQTLTNLTKGTKSANLVETLRQILDETKQNSKQLAKLEKNLANLTQDSKGHLQKVSLLRFNPFADVGGDQSFVATFLDGENSGLIISSLHSRAGTRVYAKPVDKGKPKEDIRLSKEEERALKAAIEAKNV